MQSKVKVQRKKESKPASKQICAAVGDHDRTVHGVWI